MQKSIMIYTLSTCGHCKATKKLLNESGLTYEFVDVDLLSGDARKSVVEDVKKYNSNFSFPTIIIEDEIIVGFQEDKIRIALGI